MNMIVFSRKILQVIWLSVTVVARIQIQHSCSLFCNFHLISTDVSKKRNFQYWFYQEYLGFIGKIEKIIFWLVLIDRNTCKNNNYYGKGLLGRLCFFSQNFTLTLLMLTHFSRKITFQTSFNGPKKKGKF